MSQMHEQFHNSLLLQWQSVMQDNTVFNFYATSTPANFGYFSCSFSKHTESQIKLIRLLPSSTYTPYSFIFAFLNNALSDSPYSLQEAVEKTTQYKPLQKTLMAILQKRPYKRPEIFITDYLFFENKAFTDAIIKLVEILITTPTIFSIIGWQYACPSDLKLLKILAKHNISAPLLVLISIDTQHALTHRQDDEEWESFIDWLDDAYLLHKVPNFKAIPMTGTQLESLQTLNFELVEKNILLMAWPEAISLARFLLEKTMLPEQLKQTLRLRLSEALLFDGQLDSALNELEMLQIFSEQFSCHDEKIHLLNLLSLTLTRRQNFDDAIVHAELAYQAAQQANNEQLIIQSLFINFFAHHKSSSPMPLQEFDRLNLSLQQHNMDCSRLYLLRNYYTYLRFYDELDPIIAVDVTHLAMQIARDMGHTQGIAASYHSKGIIYSYCNRYHAADRCFAVSSRIHSQIGDQNECLKIHNGKGYFNNLREQYRDAQKEYLSAFNIASQIDNDSELVVTLFNFAWLYFCTNNYQHAITILDQIVRICRIRQITHFPFRNIYDVISLKGYCHAKLEQLANAEQCLERMQGLPFKPSNS
ncbi:tetratricopeptide repeat protein [Psychromonas sp. MME1]|uniref:tetratricopeptide repeat protein n=1 Tax=Psychromonas sp. MME1 TaxID=3231032 RepID=UPI0034E1C4CC